MSDESSVTSSAPVPDTTAAEDPAGAQKFAQAALRRLNRELRAVSSCVRTLLRAESEPALLNDICRIVCEEADSPRLPKAWRPQPSGSFSSATAARPARATCSASRCRWPRSRSC